MFVSQLRRWTDWVDFCINMTNTSGEQKFPFRCFISFQDGFSYEQPTRRLDNSLNGSTKHTMVNITYNVRNLRKLNTFLNKTLGCADFSTSEVVSHRNRLCRNGCSVN